MKNFKYIGLFITSCIMMFTSCSSEDKFIDQLFDTVERGAILRTISVSGNTFNITNTASEWSVVLEEQDAQNGALFQEIKLYASLIDNTPDNGTTNSGEALVKTIPASAFSAEGTPFGLPRGTVSTTFQETLDALNLASSDIDGGDSIFLRLELVLTDGRVFTNNAGGTVTGGSFFSSPFQYSNLLICELEFFPAGDWVIDMHDSFGDGWQTDDANGGSGMTVTLNTGQVFEFGLCSPYQGSSFSCTPNFSNGTTTITIPSGITTAVWFFPGDFYGEISYEIYAPSGNLVASASAPSAGTIALNLCNE